MNTYNFNNLIPFYLRHDNKSINLYIDRNRYINQELNCKL